MPVPIEKSISRKQFCSMLAGAAGGVLLPSWTLSQVILDHVKTDNDMEMGNMETKAAGADRKTSWQDISDFYLDGFSKQVDVPNLNKGRWENIILHHSASQNGNAAIFDYYHRKIKKMENGLAYHFVIGNGSKSGDGEIECSMRWNRQIQGGHVRSNAYNQNSIGICLVGNFEETKPTDRQIKAAMELVDHLKNYLLDGSPKLLVHREIQKTLCPGKYFPVHMFHKYFG